MLGVHRNSANLVIHGELGTFPLLIDVKISMVSYYLYLRQLNNHLITDSLSENKKMHSQNNNRRSWISMVEQVINVNNINITSYQYKTKHIGDLNTRLLNQDKLKPYDDTIRDEQVVIEGFSLLRLDRNRHGGGVAFYIRETVNYEHRTDIKTSNAELLCIEVKQKCTKPFIVMEWYRPPKYEYQRIDEIETLLKSLDAEDKEIMLMCDVNCNDLDIEGKNRIWSVCAICTIHTS